MAIITGYYLARLIQSSGVLVSVINVVVVCSDVDSEGAAYNEAARSFSKACNIYPSLEVTSYP